MSPLVCWKTRGRHRNPSSCGSVGASCPDASGYKEYVTRCYTTTTNNNQGISNFKYLVALAGLLPICLLVARLAGLPWEVLSTRN